MPPPHSIGYPGAGAQGPPCTGGDEPLSQKKPALLSRERRPSRLPLAALPPASPLLPLRPASQGGGGLCGQLPVVRWESAQIVRKTNLGEATGGANVQPELERGPGVGWTGSGFWRALCKWTVLPWLSLGWILRAGLKPCGLVNDTQRLLPAFQQPLPPPLLSTLSGFTVKQFWEKGEVAIIWTPLCGRPSSNT